MSKQRRHLTGLGQYPEGELRKLTWQGIAADITARIESGELTPGTRIEPEESMAVRLGVPRHMVHRALHQLQMQGLLVRRRRWGTVVAERKAPASSKKRIAYLVDFTSNRFQMDIISHLEHALNDGTRLVVAVSKNDPEREAEHLATLPDDVDGIICYPVDGDANSQAFLDLANSGYPLVLLDRAPRGCEHLVVQTDNSQASQLAVTDLMERGHQRIAFFGSSNDRAQSVRERFLGYRKTVESLGYDTRPYERWIPLLLEESSELMYQTISDGFAVMRALPEPPTAAFCIQDRLASGVIDACQTYGLEVGIDFGVATYNDFGPSFFRYPNRIDRVVQRMEEVSESAIARLDALMRGEDAGPGPVRIAAQFFPAEDPRQIISSSLYAHAGGPP